MKASRKTIVSVTIASMCILLLGGSILHARYGHFCPASCRSPEDHASRVRDLLTRKLDLDASQQKELDTMIGELVEKGKGLHSLHQTSRQEVLTLLREDTLDRRRAETLADEHQEQLGEFSSLLHRRLLDFAVLLTPDQRSRLADAIEEHAEWHHL